MTTKLAAVVLLVLGAILLFYGVQATGSVGEKISDGLTGEYTRSTTRYLVGGAVAAAAGVALLLFGRRSA